MRRWPQVVTSVGKTMQKGAATVAQLEEFDEIIDARTPAEFAEDHIPGAVNLPVLDNEQRVVVGTMYKQQSPFEARRVGGAMVAENIARHVYGYMQGKPKRWRPLIYCWRGGQRSGAFTTWLRMIGWDAHQLIGGYKTFRHHVIATLEQRAPGLQLHVVCGATGSGKTRVLEALARRGAQVLDLEDLAAHKGSVLGALPSREQPAQKAFETAIYDRIRHFTPDLPVFVEAESRKIGRLHVPEPLIEHMRRSPCIAIEARPETRLAFLVRDYAYLGDDVPALCRNIERLQGLQSNETLARWLDLARTGALETLFSELIALHYDPLYQRSQGGNFADLPNARRIAVDDLSPEGIDGAAQRILSAVRA